MHLWTVSFMHVEYFKLLKHSGNFCKYELSTNHNYVKIELLLNIEFFNFVDRKAEGCGIKNDDVYFLYFATLDLLKNE